MFKHFWVFWACWIPIACMAQQTISPNGLKGISVAVMHESTTWPFTSYTPIHPGVEVEVTLRETHGVRSLQRWNVALGGYFHERAETGIYLRGGYQYGWEAHRNLRLDASGGIGYMHHFYPNEVYEIDPETGDFSAINQLGKPRVIADVGLGLAFPNNSRFEPFIRQHFAVEAPFANGIPFFPHSLLKIGVTYTFKS
ncbi:hypothetical protein [Pontibacter sp. G13]|uniref:hypothetical protein n=1 Tax=Pontibacter sp. G13 TaxID=3074898 RepID=UPI00288C463E|nr:hypothetical protein [Pontibacter sp. G13]WNJ20325.1 hypothetical protein RJD25_07580 [Pontibacter sp. G13]